MPKVLTEDFEVPEEPTRSHNFISDFDELPVSSHLKIHRFFAVQPLSQPNQLFEDRDEEKLEQGNIKTSQRVNYDDLEFRSSFSFW